MDETALHPLGQTPTPSRQLRVTTPRDEEIPIDPALLDEELGVDEDLDAEGEIVEEETEQESIQASHRDPPPPDLSPFPSIQAGPSNFTPRIESRPRKRKLKDKVPLPRPKGKRATPDAICSFCMIRVVKKDGKKEHTSCYTCGQTGHFRCLNIKNERLKENIRSYDWQCVQCKICEVCKREGEDILFCDGCDKGYHGYCAVPRVDPSDFHPDKSWICPECTPSTSKTPRTNHTPRPKAPNLSSARKGKSKALPPLPTSRLKTPLHPLIKIKSHSTPSRLNSTPSLPPLIKLRLPKKPELEEPEEEKVPYGGIITGEDADVSKTTIGARDLENFESSRRKAEERLGGPGPGLGEAGLGSGIGSGIWEQTNGKNLNGSTSTPNRLSPTPSSFSQSHTLESYRPLRNQLPRESTTGGTGMGKMEKINKIRFGVYDIDTWYSAPYPEEYQWCLDGRLWICEFCLKFMKSGFVGGRHRLKCKARHPPGDEIYRDGNVSVFEVDGRKNKIYCQNLCLLAKMFLDHKTLYYDVEPFLFYVMTEVDELGARFVGYFSKEKRSLGNNVSCIMTLPVRQRRGWGGGLIEFSYLLSKKEGRVGSPEKPLSGLGEVAYKKYWQLTVFRFLRDCPGDPKIEDISSATSMTPEDIYSTLLLENMITPLDPLQHTPIKPKSTPTPRRSRGRPRIGPRSTTRPRPSQIQPLPAKSNEIKIPTRYSITWDREYVNAVLKKYDEKGYLVIRGEKLKYHPFLVTRMIERKEKEVGGIARAVIGEGTELGSGAKGLASGEGEEVNGHDEEEDGGLKEGVEEEVLAGEDEATRKLVAALNEEPKRTLRVREVDTPRRGSRKRARTGGEVEPRRKSLRGLASLPHVNGSGVANGIGGENDEGEEYDKPFDWGDVANGHDEPLPNGHGDSGDELALSSKEGWEQGASGHVSVIDDEGGDEDAEGEDDDTWGQEDADGEDDEDFVA